MFSKIFTTVKYMLVSVNFLFVITGIIILSVGASVQSAYNQYHPFLSDRFFSLPAFCIATGIIIFLIAAAGFYGAFMENYLMNMAFAGAMVVILIFQISACIFGYALRSNTLVIVQAQLTSTMVLYGTGPGKNPEVTQLWDEVQKNFECCGVTNSSDWLIPLGTTVDEGLPMSCCSPGVGVIQTANCTVPVSFAPGCADAFGEFIQSHAASIGVTGIFLVIMQATAVAGALWMAKISREEHGAYP